MLQAAWFQIVLRLALCALAVYPMWWWLGPVGLVLTMPLFGIALAKPLLTLGSDLFHGTRELAMRDLEGRHYEFRGTPIDVIQDADCVRWVRLADVRKLLPGLPADAVFARTHPDSCRFFGQPALGYLSDEALVAYLDRATASETLKFRHWVERTVALPARTLRARRGAPSSSGEA